MGFCNVGTAEKTRMMPLADRQKLCHVQSFRHTTPPPLDVQTDTRTDRQTDRIGITIKHADEGHLLAGGKASCPEKVEVTMSVGPWGWGRALGPLKICTGWPS